MTTTMTGKTACAEEMNDLIRSIFIDGPMEVRLANSGNMRMAEYKGGRSKKRTASARNTLQQDL
jgi:hypothetical protein